MGLKEKIVNNMKYIDCHYNPLIPLKILVMACDYIEESGNVTHVKVAEVKPVMRSILLANRKYSCPELADETLIDEWLDGIVEEAMLALNDFFSVFGDDATYKALNTMLDDLVPGDPVVEIDYVEIKDDEVGD